MIDGLDHVIVGVRDLDGARDAYARLGFTLTPRGSHIGWGTANYCIMFPDDYVELLGIADATKFSNNLDAFLETREGLLGIAFATSDAEAAARDLAERGIAAEGPSDLARNLELPEGTVQPEFKLLFPAAEALPGLAAPAPAFLCQHLTPALMRRPEWLDHANGAKAIAGLTVLAEDPAALAPAYAALFGQEAANLVDDILDVRVGDASIRFVQPGHVGRLHPAMTGSLSAALPAAPAIVALSVAVTDTTVVAELLDEAGVETARVGSTISVGPADAGGLRLEFVWG